MRWEDGGVELRERVVRKICGEVGGWGEGGG